MSDEQVANAPILVLGNKIDVPGAVSEDELRTIFALHGRTTGKVSPLACGMSSDVCVVQGSTVRVLEVDLQWEMYSRTEACTF